MLNLDVLDQLDLEFVAILKLYNPDPKVYGYNVAEYAFVANKGNSAGIEQARTIASAFGLEIDIIENMRRKHPDLAAAE